MENALLLLSEKLSAVVPFIVLLGLLIFVHELGHFLVAKFFGVRVETFSLGFGKKLLKYKRGDTTYALSWIPLGGYVKMFGDDPSAVISDEQKRYSFLHKPVGQRIGIVLAGPLMNLFFAVVLFAIVAWIGSPVAAPTIGEVAENTVAFESGFRTGDTIREINGRQISFWHEAQELIKNSQGQLLRFTVKREGSGEISELEVTPAPSINDDLFSLAHEVGAIAGLGLYSKAPVIGVTDHNSPAWQAGLRPLDVIEKINGEEVLFFRRIGEMLASSRGQEKIELVVSEFRLDDQKETSRTIVLDGRTLPESAGEVMRHLGIEDSELYLGLVNPGSPAEKAGLQRGDRILSINGKDMNGWEDVVSLVGSFTPESGSIIFNLQREGKQQTVEVKPQMTELMNQKLQEEQRFTVGIRSGIASTTAVPVTERYSHPVQIVRYAIDKTIYWTEMVVVSLVKIVAGSVSPRNIAGIVTIGRVANQSYEVGLFAFLRVMAIISINLFLLNLLPIPVLDGGHLLFFSIEGLRGAPLSMKKMEIAQQVGLILMMTLMAFALFNDIRNWISAPF